MHMRSSSEKVLKGKLQVVQLLTHMIIFPVHSCVHFWSTCLQYVWIRVNCWSTHSLLGKHASQIPLSHLLPHPALVHCTSHARGHELSGHVCVE